MKRLQIAKNIATLATICSVSGLLLQFFLLSSTIPKILWYVACILGITSYCFGGFLNMIKLVEGFAVAGWHCAPFIYRCVTVPAAIVLGCMVFIFLPIIPVKMTYDEYMGK
ncbi:MAG: hypothetical protein EGQ41_08815 [Clostridiales bacterium]|nr:hypothetical protein [Clostridiales bacterium]